MYFDGTLNRDGAGAGVLFISPKGEQLKYVLQLLSKATNNAAEYEALIHGLWIAVTLGIKRLLVEAKFCGLEFHHVPRDDNVAVDVLSKLGSKRSIVPPGIFVQALNSPMVKSPTWSRT